MDRYRKKLINSAAILPAVIAVAATIIFFAVTGALDLPFTESESIFAEYESADTVTAQTVDIKESTIKKSELTLPKKNMVIGTVNYSDKSMELIFGANDKNAMDRFDLDPAGKLMGETGTTAASCYKNNASFLNSLKKGDTIEISTYYGDYRYRVVNTLVADNASQAVKAGDGIGKALVLYTDAENSPGISEQCFAVVCQMTEGRPVE